MVADDDNADALGWKAEYAKSGRSKCRSSQETIEQGALRIGKTIVSPYSDKPGATIEQWYSIEGFLAYIRKGRMGKARPESSGGIVGFDDLKKADQKKLVDLLDTVNENVAALKAAPEERFENTAGDNNKWWSMTVAGSVTLVKWGQIGDEQAPGMSRKEHADEAAAEKFAAKTVASKEKGGYVKCSDAVAEVPKPKAQGGNKRKAKPEPAMEAEKLAAKPKKAAAEETLDLATVKKLTVPKLRSALEEREMATDGTKAVLLKRLSDYLTCL